MSSYTPDGNMYNSLPGISSKSEMLSWKFLASTSFGMWLSQSVTWVQASMVSGKEYNLSGTHREGRILAKIAIVKD